MSGSLDSMSVQSTGSGNSQQTSGLLNSTPEHSVALTVVVSENVAEKGLLNNDGGEKGLNDSEVGNAVVVVTELNGEIKSLSESSDVVS